MTTRLAAALLTLAACSHPTSSQTIPPPGAGASSGAAAPSSAPASQATSGDADMELVLAFMGDLGKIVDEDKGACDKMGDDLNAYLDGYQPRMNQLTQAVTRIGKLSPDDQNALRSKYADRYQAVMGQMGAAEACKANPKVQKAQARLPRL